MASLTNRTVGRSVLSPRLGGEPGRNGQASQLDLAPVLDVIFILIIFLVVFIVSVILNTEATDGVSIQLPRVSTDYRDRAQPSGNTSRRIVVSVTADGKLFLADKNVSLEDLGRHLEEAPKATIVVLRGAASADWQVIADVVSRIKAAGKQSLFLKVEQSQE